MPGTAFARVDELVRTLTLPVALKLVDALGGRAYYVPHAGRLHDEHPIVRAIGMDSARLLAEEWPQMDIMIPRCSEILRKLRNQALAGDAAAMSVPELARKYDLTERMVYYILAGVPETAAVEQRKLF